MKKKSLPRRMRNTRLRAENRNFSRTRRAQGSARSAPHTRSPLALDRPSRSDCCGPAGVDCVARERTSIPELQRGQNRKESGARRSSASVATEVPSASPDVQRSPSKTSSAADAVSGYSKLSESRDLRKQQTEESRTRDALATHPLEERWKAGGRMRSATPCLSSS